MRKEKTKEKSFLREGFFSQARTGKIKNAKNKNNS
jgi:hypothetical protein